MGKSLVRNDSYAPGNYPRCMAGIFQILDYHHWHLKNLLPQKKQSGKTRRVKRNQNQKVILENRDHDAVFMDVDCEVEPLLAKQHDTESVPARKRRGKARSKFPSEENHKSWILWFSLNSWLQRINPMHHLVPFENCSDDIDTPQKRNAMTDTNKYNEASKDVSDQQLGECVDVLEIFKVNKEFFLKILQEPDACTNRPHGLKNSSIKVKLSKSRSFPVANSPQATLVRPSTLKHKQSEVWFFLNDDKSVVDTREFRKEGETIQTEVSSGLSSSHGHGWNQVVISRFRDIKHKIKHALKEGKRERVNPIEATEILERLEKTMNPGGERIDGSNDDLETQKLQRVSRTSSLNESLHRYTHLLDNTWSRDTKYTHSRSLTISSSEVKVHSQSRKECRRNLSLPDLDSLSSFLNVAPIDALRLARAYSRASVDYSADLLTVDENDNEMCLTHEIPEPDRESNVCQEEEVFLEAENESCLSSSEVLPTSEGIELDTKCVQTDEINCYYLQQVAENEDFKYVRQILELSTFICGNEASTWQSLDQPLSPSLFKHLENQFHQELACCEDDMIINHHDHQLLFDLVNETLGDMNEKSYTYFPRPHSRPLPTGNGLLKDVWSMTSWYLNLRPELDKSLDDVVARDLAKRDAKWMSLEWEREMVALELEDLFFDELLDEVLCCLD